MNRTPEEIEKIKLQSKLVKRFNKACANYHLIEDGDTILIGVSGGKDSLALIELMGRRAKIHVPKFTVKAVHVRVTERNYLTDISSKWCPNAILLHPRVFANSNIFFRLYHEHRKQGSLSPFSSPIWVSATMRGTSH